MFKDVFVLKKNSYNVRLMKYIWNWDHRDFSHMCPYFWLSLFNHIAILFVFPIRILIKALKAIGRTIDLANDTYLEYSREKERERLKRMAIRAEQDPSYLFKISKKMVDKLLSRSNFTSYEKYELVYESYYDAKREKERAREIEKSLAKEAKEQAKFEREIESIKKSKLISEEIIVTKSAYQLKSEYEKALAEAEKQRVIRNKQRITKILKIVKPLLTWGSYTIGSAIGMVVLYYLIKFAIWGCNRVSNIKASTWEKFGEGVLNVGIVIVGITIIGLMFYFLFRFLKNISFSVSVKETKFSKNCLIIGKWIIAPFIFILKLIKRFCRAIRNAVLLVIQMIKNECPAIKWED